MSNLQYDNYLEDLVEQGYDSAEVFRELDRAFTQGRITDRQLYKSLDDLEYELGFDDINESEYDDEQDS